MRRQFGKSYGTWMVRWWAKEEEGYGPSRKEKKKMPGEHPKRTESNAMCADVFDAKEMLTILLDYVGPAAA